MSKKKGGKKKKGKKAASNDEDDDMNLQEEQYTEAINLQEELYTEAAVKLKAPSLPPPPPPPPPLAPPPVPPPLVDIVQENIRHFNCELKAWGFEDSSRAGYIRVNGKCYKDFTDSGKDKYRGLYVVIMKTGCQDSAQTLHFDFWGNSAASTLFSELVDTAPKGAIIMGASADEIHKNSSNANQAFKSLGIKVSEHISYRCSLCFIAKKGYKTFVKVKSSLKNAGPTELYDSVRGRRREVADSIDEHGNKIRQTGSFVPLPTDLLDMKKRLTKVDHGRTKVLLGRDILVDDNKNSVDRFPLETLRDAFNVPGNGIVSRLDLTGVDQLTDSVCYHMKNLHSKSMLAVEHVTLTGCLNLTDNGIKWLAQLFNDSLKEVVLSGCKKLTEKSIHHLYVNCPKLTHINMICCDVGCVQPFGDNIEVHVELLGCPLLSPSPSALNDDKGTRSLAMFNMKELRRSPLCNQYKAVLIKDPHLLDSLTLITSSTSSSPDSAVHAQMALDCDGKQFNVIECPSGLYTMFMSDRTLYVITYDVSRTDTRAVVEYVFSIITHVLNKYPDCVFSVVGVGEGNTPQNIEDQLTPLLESKLEQLKDEVERTNSKIYSDQLSVSYEDQVNMQCLHTLSDALSDVLKGRRKSDSNLPPKIHFHNKVLQPNQPYGTNRLKELLKERVDDINHYNPCYTRFDKELTQLFTSVPNPQEIVTKEEYIALLKSAVNVTGENISQYNHATYRKCIQYLEMLGLVIEVPNSAATSAIITEATLPQFCSAINNLFTSTRSDQFGPVPASTPGIKAAELQDKLLHGLLELNLACMVKDDAILAAALPLTPNVPLSHFLNPALDDELYMLVYSFNCAGQNIPAVVMHNVVCAANRIKPAKVLSKWCVVIQESPVDVIIQAPGAVRSKPDGTEATEKPVDVIQLTCQMTKPQNEKELKEVVKLVKNTADTYKVVVDYILATHQMYSYTMDYCRYICYSDLLATVASCTYMMCSVFQKVEDRQEDYCYEREDGIYGVTTEHGMEEVTSSGEETKRCRDCFMKPESTRLLWRMECYLRPTLTSMVMVRSQESHTQQGSWFSTANPQKQQGIQCNTRMSAGEFSQFEVTVLQGEVLNILLSSHGKTSTYMLSMSDHHIQHNYLTRREEPNKEGDDSISDDEEEDYKVQPNNKIDTLYKDLNIKAGDRIKVELKPTEQLSKELMSFYVNEELLLSTRVKSNRRFSPIITNSKGSATYIVDANKAKGGGGQSEKFEKLMRFEALDRLNPSLVCCATIIDIRESTGEILVHFDGWTDRYDYWTQPDSADLHPVGFMKARASHHSELNQELQKPKSYGRAFDWDKYLVEERSPPVPYHLFNSKQTEGCPEQVYKASTIDFFARLGISLSAKSTACKTSKHTAGAHKKTMMKHGNAILATAEEWLDNRVPLFVSLPSKLSEHDILYPSNVATMRKTVDIYPLCPVKGNMHFLNSPCKISPPDDFDAASGFNSMIRIILIAMQNLLPSEFNKLFPTLKQFSKKEVEDGLRNMFYLTMCDQYFSGTVIIDNSGLVTSGEGSMQNLWELFLKDYSAPEIGLEQFVSLSGEQEDRRGCTGHTRAIQANSGMAKLDTHQFHPYTSLITKLNFSHNELKSLPDDFFSAFNMLIDLNISHNQLESLPVGDCPKLQMLDISYNLIKEVPEVLGSCKDHLVIINLSGNHLVNLPHGLFECTNLVAIEAANIELTSLPETIGNLKKLKMLILSGNSLTELPEAFSQLTELVELDLSGMKFADSTDSRSLMSVEALTAFFKSHALLARKSEQEIQTLFNGFDTTKKGTMDRAEIAAFNKWLITNYTRIGFDPNINKESGCIPPQIFSLHNLEVLSLKYLLIKSVPEAIKGLTKLRSLHISHNEQLDSLSPHLANCPQLESLNVKACPSLRTPPKEIVSRGFNAVMGYLKRLLMGSVECKRTKLMMVGLGGAGKTSLVRTLTGGSNPSHYYGYSPSDELTDGIDIMNWTVEDDDSEGQAVTYSVWDFAGQVVYYNTHQFFMSNRAVYLLLWNIRLGHEHAGLEFWLSSIACHAPKAPIIVVGTHKDQVEKYWIPEVDMRKRYPQIRSFHAISTYTHIGIEELKHNLLQETLKQKYMGEKVPEAWLKLESKMVSKKAECLLTWKTVEDMAMEVGIYDPPEMRQAVAFLHDLGSVQHFKNEYLKTRVVIDPQWIVDAMACVVSVHDTPIKEGRLEHKDLAKIWSNYDSKLLPWLLRLTEEFDLTFPIPDSKLNIVPCLLPSTEPEIEWPDVNDFPGHRETKMIYQFAYLPTGLFNRAQVRLYVFSDSSTIWKKGSLLKKNGHYALMEQIKDKGVLVKVQGPRPENILFLIHEVYETMIMESFHGVTYDFYIPCQDCVKAGKHEPCLFPASRVRRATELKAPFLQCDMFFHTLSINELHAIMPPDNNEDYDVHLERSLRELKDLRDDLTYDLFLIYSAKNIPAEGEEAVHPKQIYQDLVKAGFKVWFSDEPDKINIEDVIVTMRDARLILTCVSDDFVKDERALKLYMYCKDNLKKMTQLLVVGNSFNWQKTNFGMHMASEVFVNMTQPKRYQHKMSELCDTLRGKMTTLQSKFLTKYPKVFVSYCWSNSADAVKKGTRQVPGSLGWGDPRVLKDYLEDNGITCWMDVERVGQGGLFEDIADGLRHAKVVVVCVSDEYARSTNCKVEFRFAAISLKLPMVLAVVGTGLKWESSEIGMLSLGYPKVSLQHKTEGANERLLDAVKGLLPEDTEEKEEVLEQLTGTNNVNAFQELLELAQRKFLRQLASYCKESEASVVFPRLFIVDFLRPEELQLLRDKEIEEIKRERDEQRKAAAVAELIALRARQTRLEERRKRLEKFEQAGETEKRKKKKRGGDSEEGNRPMSALRKEEDNLKEALKDLESDRAKATEEKLNEESVTSYTFCVRFLCEREEGWHEVMKYIPIKTMTSHEWNDFLKEIAGYMARVLAIVRHSGLDLEITKNTEQAQEQLRVMEELCGLKSEFSSHYLYLRNLIIDWHEDQERVIINKHSALNRCHLPSGKTIWLCKGHQDIDRITVFTDGADLIAEMEDDGELAVAQDNAAQEAGAPPAEVPATLADVAAMVTAEQNAGTADFSAAPKPPDGPKPPKPTPRRSLQKRASERLEGTKGTHASAKLASGNVGAAAAQSKACSIM